MLGLLDTAFCVIGVLVSFWCSYEMAALASREGSWSAGATFLGTIAAFMFAVGVGAVWALVARVRVSETGVAYRSWRLRLIPWSSIIEIRFPIISPKSGFTPKVFIRTRDGRAHFISLGTDALKGVFNPLSGYKEEPNQTLEPTRVLGTSAAEPPRVPSTRVAHL